jgi:hypothetical protein
LNALSHALGALSVFALASAIAVFGFGLTEIAGPVGSFFLNFLVSALVAGAGGAGFSVASQSGRRRPTPGIAFALGVVVGAVVASLMWLGPAGVGFSVLLGAMFLLSSASALFCPREAT